MIEFDSFRLDLENQRLWRGESSVGLRLKAWDVLVHLATNPGRLCTRDELLDAVWPGLAVTPASLNQTISELRSALGDDARKPRFVETVPRRGFRFIAPVREGSGSARFDRAGERGRTTSESLPGREAELAKLARLLAAARAGVRQIVFVTGETGIGKTTLVETFLARVAGDDDTESASVGTGRCVEMHGEGEAFLPFLEALERLAREVGGEVVRRVLSRWAPNWLAQLPWLEAAPDRRSGMLEPGALPRMLREFCLAIEALSAERTVVLWLEDLHWSDPSTIDLLSALGERTEPARLLIIASYRPVEAAVANHPVAGTKRSLLGHRKACEIALELLPLAAVESYLGHRLGLRIDPDLPPLIHAQTDGNPLFMVTLVEQLLGNGEIDAGERGWTLMIPPESLHDRAPASLAELVDAQCERLTSEDRETLEAASVVGETFSAQAVAAALGVSTDVAEKRCGRLAGWRHFIEPAGPGVWPDGSAGERFAFLHEVFRRFIYQRIPAGRRQCWHGRVGERLEAGHGSDAIGMSAHLAFHFERAQDPTRAIHHLERAATAVRRRFADREAVAHLERALRLLDSLPDSTERAHRELELRMLLARAAQNSISYIAGDRVANLDRTQALAERLEDTSLIMKVLSFRVRAEGTSGFAEAYRKSALAHARVGSLVEDPVIKAQINSELGNAAFVCGDLEAAESHHAAVAGLADRFDSREANTAVGVDPVTMSLGFGALSAWIQGRPDTAKSRASAAVSRAEIAVDPLGLSIGLTYSAIVARLRGETQDVCDLDSRLAACQEEYGLSLPYPQAFAVHGWRLLQERRLDEARAVLRTGLAETRERGIRSCSSMLSGALAEVELARGDPASGLGAIEQAWAFVDETGERFWEAELHRLYGELLISQGHAEDASNSFLTAYERASQQQAHSFALRAATSLVRMDVQLSMVDRRSSDAQARLAQAYDAVLEGRETHDLREARTLLTTARG